MTHLVEVDRNEDDELYVVRFVCEAAPEALCRAWCADGCEEVCLARTVYVAAEPLLLAQAPPEGHRFVPMDPPSCRVADWLNVGDAYDRAELYSGIEVDERGHVLLRPGRRPIEDEWDGDGYLWSYADEVAEPAHPGYP